MEIMVLRPEDKSPGGRIDRDAGACLMLQMPTHRPREKLTKLVEQILARKSAPQPVAFDAKLTDIGFDSLDMVNLMLAIEAEFDLMIAQPDITPENFRSIATIEALIATIAPSA
jgi:acyl carrier protein